MQATPTSHTGIGRIPSTSPWQPFFVLPYTSVRVHVRVRLIIPSTRRHRATTVRHHPTTSSAPSPTPSLPLAPSPVLPVPRIRQRHLSLPPLLSPSSSRTERDGNKESENDRCRRVGSGEEARNGETRRHDPHVQPLPFLLPFRTFCCSCCRDLSTSCFRPRLTALVFVRRAKVRSGFPPPRRYSSLVIPVSTPRYETRLSRFHFEEIPSFFFLSLS